MSRYSVLDENRVGYIQSWMRTGMDVFRAGLDVFSV